MTKRLVEVFIAGCPLFVETAKMMRELAYSNCEVKIYNIHKESAAEQKKRMQYGIYRVPAVVVNSKSVKHCSSQQLVSRQMLIAVNIGQG